MATASKAHAARAMWSRAGGIIDIALLKYLKPHWLLYRKDHTYSTWVLHSVVGTLHAALEILLPDEERVFWP